MRMTVRVRCLTGHELLVIANTSLYRYLHTKYRIELLSRQVITGDYESCRGYIKGVGYVKKGKALNEGGCKDMICLRYEIHICYCYFCNSGKHFICLYWRSVHLIKYAYMCVCLCGKLARITTASSLQIARSILQAKEELVRL